MSRSSGTPFVRLAACVAILGAVACDNTASISSFPAGIAVVTADAAGGGTYTAAPVVSFQRTNSFSFASATQVSDTCVQDLYTAGTGVVTGSVGTFLGAGQFVKVLLSGHLDSLTRHVGDGTYTLTNGTGFPSTPGDSITLTVPGDVAGFPAATMKARTSEPFTFTTPTVPAAGQGMTLSWTPALDNSAAMIVSLRYNTAANVDLNQQIYCEFRDDGGGAVRAILATQFAAGTIREAQFTRIRTNLIRAPGSVEAYLGVITAFEAQAIPIP